MAPSLDQFMDAIVRRRKQLDEVLESYMDFRQKLEALPPEIAREAEAMLSSASGSIDNPQARAKQGDLVGKSSLQCAKIIIIEKNNAPTHFSDVAREALRRGYVGRMSGSSSAVESRATNSFWAAMSRSHEFKSAGKGCYQLATWPQNSLVASANIDDAKDKTAHFHVEVVGEGQAVSVQGDSWAGKAAKLLLAKGPLPLSEIVTELRGNDPGQETKNWTGTINSALWRRKDIFVLKDGRYSLVTRNIRFTG